MIFRNIVRGAVGQELVDYLPTRLSNLTISSIAASIDA